MLTRETLQSRLKAYKEVGDDDLFLDLFVEDINDEVRRRSQIAPFPIRYSWWVPVTTALNSFLLLILVILVTHNPTVMANFVAVLLVVGILVLGGYIWAAKT